MILKVFYVLAELIGYIFNEFRILRISGTGKHKVLPDKESKFIAKVVEEIIFIEATPPDSKHIHITGFGKLKQLPIFFIGYPGNEKIGWDPVGSPGKDIPTVNVEPECVFITIF